MSESAPPIPNPNVQGTNSSGSVTAATGTGSGAGSNADQAGNRGLPYYEKLRRELRDTLQRKRLMDKSMVSFLPTSAYRPEMRCDAMRSIDTFRL